MNLFSRIVITLVLAVLSSHYAMAYHNISPYAWCGGNPIKFVDPNGRQPVKYVDENGVKHIDWSIVIMTKALKPTATDKQIAKHELYKRKLAENMLNELDTYLNSKGQGAMTSEGDRVYSTFDIHVVDVENTHDDEKAKQLSIQYAQEIKENQAGKNGNAAVFMDCSTNGAFGLTRKAMLITISGSAPKGTNAHEVYHTTGIPDNGYLRGGILASPPELIIPKEVTEMWNIIQERK